MLQRSPVCHKIFARGGHPKFGAQARVLLDAHAASALHPFFTPHVCDNGLSFLARRVRCVSRPELLRLLRVVRG